MQQITGNDNKVWHWVGGGVLVVGLIIGFAFIWRKLNEVLDAVNNIPSQKLDSSKKSDDVIDVEAETVTESHASQSESQSAIVNVKDPASFRMSESQSESTMTPDLTENRPTSDERPIVIDSESHSESESSKTSESDLPAKFQATPDFRTIKANGFQFQLTFTQGRVTKYLWENLKKGITKVHQDILLEGLGICSKKMKDVFRNSKAWRKLVVPDGKGYYRLNLD